MDLISLALFGLLLFAALAVFIFEDLLYIVIIFGVYSMVMSLLWQRLNSPDLAITEAAVGLGTTILLVVVITRLGREPG